MTRYVTIDYRGTEYELLFDLYAMEMIEDEFGSMPAMAKEMDSGKSYKSLKKLFKILVNAAYESRDSKKTVTGDEIRRATPEEIIQVRDAVLEALRQGKKTETNDGEEASDEHRDLYQDEDDEKNA